MTIMGKGKRVAGVAIIDSPSPFRSGGWGVRSAGAQHDAAHPR